MSDSETPNTDKLVELAVKAYVRRGKSGQQEQVGGYDRAAGRLRGPATGSGLANFYGPHAPPLPLVRRNPAHYQNSNHHHEGRIADLRSHARQDRAKAHELQKELHKLVWAHAGHVAAAKKAAATAKHHKAQHAAAQKAGKGGGGGKPGKPGKPGKQQQQKNVVHHKTQHIVHHHRAVAHHKHAATLAQRIKHLRGEIHRLLAQARSLDAQAAAL